MSATIRVYRLVDPSVLYLNADKIAYYFFGMPQLSGVSGKSFTVSAQTGFFTYTHYEQLYTNHRKEKLPKNANEAQKTADSFMQRANALVQNERFFKDQKFPKLFSNLKFISAKSVGHPEKLWIDHWVALYQGYVKPSQEEDSVPVLDSKVEFKIGVSGMVIGLDYQWGALQGSDMYNIVSKRYSNVVYAIEDDTELLLSPYFLKDV